mgnify:CR=1 FL=1
MTLVTSGKDAPDLLKKVDYKTLLFFVGLFIVVGGLEQTGILEIIAGFIADVSGDNAMLMVAIVLWISAIASAFVDNIPFAATMVPVITSLSATHGGRPEHPGLDPLHGDGHRRQPPPPSGPRPTVAGTSIAAREGHPISWAGTASTRPRPPCWSWPSAWGCSCCATEAPHERIHDRRTRMLHQGLALAIAAFTFLQLLRGKWPRHVLTLAAGGLMVVVVLLGVMGSLDAVMEALSVDSFGKPQFWFAHGGVTERNVGINWSTVLFLVGMMVMVEGMSEAGFFDWLCLRLAKSLGFRPMPLLLSFMAVAALLSMFVDSITVVLFLVVATVRLARLLRI